MGDLRIADSSWGGADCTRSRFSVKVEGNFTISNTKDKYNLGTDEGLYRVDVKNGNPTIYFGRTQRFGPERELSVMWRNFNVFDALRKADKNDKKGEKLTQSDLEALRKDKALQKKLGVTVKYDPEAKVYGIYGEGGKKIFFDFE